jgi:NAD(P)-dependent dehydrogenase (short-subunit alcohol dehydrogenase family)
MSIQKVAVITGASQGIGAALVAAYQDLGYAVVANSRSIAPANTDGLATVAGDIGTADVAQRVVRTAIDRFGRIDTVVNNAGVFVAKPFVEYTQEDYDDVLRTNVAGFFHRCSHRATGATSSTSRRHWSRALCRCSRQCWPQ